MKKILLLLSVSLLVFVGCKKTASDSAKEVEKVSTKHTMQGRLILRSGDYMLLEMEEGDHISIVNVADVLGQCDSVKNEEIIAIGYNEQNGDTIMAVAVNVLEHWVEGIVVSMDEHSVVIVSDIDSFKFSIDKALIYGDDDLAVGADIIVYYPNSFEVGNGGDIPATRILIE